MILWPLWRRCRRSDGYQIAWDVGFIWFYLGAWQIASRPFLTDSARFYSRKFLAIRYLSDYNDLLSFKAESHKSGLCF